LKKKVQYRNENTHLNWSPVVDVHDATLALLSFVIADFWPLDFSKNGQKSLFDVKLLLVL